MICEHLPKTHVRDVLTTTDGTAVVSGVWVRLDYTACHLGGKRCWFLCPNCNRRCAILYPVKCRICLNLHYVSEHESPLDRKFRAAFKHRETFGQTTGGIAVPFPAKPKGMRWHTYLKARQKAQTSEADLIRAFAGRVRNVGAQIARARRKF